MKSVLKSSILFLCVALLCSGCYLLKQGRYILKYTRQAVAVEKLQKSPATPGDMKKFLALVQEIRTFASEKIGLAENDNYTSCVISDKKYLVDVVYAAASDNFTQYEWRYPFFGRFPYKGFFERADAQKEAERLKSKGYDVSIGRVRAFSSLGIIADPLYSFMKDDGVFHLANTIIHEQTHATMYLKNQVQFNEELATFIGREGALAFIKSKYGDSSEEYRNGKKEVRDDSLYSALIHSLYQTLDTLYKSAIPMQEKLQNKQRIISRFKDSIAENYSAIFTTPSYKGIENAAINNAYIAIEITYTLDLKLFYELYALNNQDLSETITRLKSLKKTREDPKKRIKQMVLQLKGNCL